MSPVLVMTQTERFCNLTMSVVRGTVPAAAEECQEVSVHAENGSGKTSQQWAMPAWSVLVLVVLLGCADGGLRAVGSCACKCAHHCPATAKGCVSLTPVRCQSPPL